MCLLCMGCFVASRWENCGSLASLCDHLPAILQPSRINASAVRSVDKSITCVAIECWAGSRYDFRFVWLR